MTSLTSILPDPAKVSRRDGTISHAEFGTYAAHFLGVDREHLWDLFSSVTNIACWETEPVTLDMAAVYLVAAGLLLSHREDEYGCVEQIFDVDLGNGMEGEAISAIVTGTPYTFTRNAEYVSLVVVIDETFTEWVREFVRADIRPRSAVS